jgi:hypothetical protein
MAHRPSRENLVLVRVTVGNLAVFQSRTLNGLKNFRSPPIYQMNYRNIDLGRRLGRVPLNAIRIRGAESFSF